MKFFAGIESTIENKYLPIKYHSLISEMLGGQGNSALEEIISKIIVGDAIIKDEDSQWLAVVRLTKYFNHRQTEEIINKLR